jgi:tRNA threonylcarbamoyladenosine biosynthesis protein TsaE
MYSFISRSENDTLEFSAKLATEINADLSKAVLILLEGDYGTGKTHFVKGFAKGLGITELITSPSYVYMIDYKFGENSKLVHVDAWRVKSAEELELTGIKKYLIPGNIVIVEWGNKLSGDFVNSNDVKVIKITMEEKGENERLITIND